MSIATTNLSNFLSEHHQLESLRLDINTNRGGVVSPVTNFEEWLEILLTLPKLRALRGVKLFYEISTHNIP